MNVVCSRRSLNSLRIVSNLGILAEMIAVIFVVVVVLIVIGVVRAIINQAGY